MRHPHTLVAAAGIALLGVSAAYAQHSTVVVRPLSTVAVSDTTTPTDTTKAPAPDTTKAPAPAPDTAKKAPAQ